ERSQAPRRFHRAFHRDPGLAETHLALHGEWVTAFTQRQQPTDLAAAAHLGVVECPRGLPIHAIARGIFGVETVEARHHVQAPVFIDDAHVHPAQSNALEIDLPTLALLLLALPAFVHPVMIAR